MIAVDRAEVPSVLRKNRAQWLRALIAAKDPTARRRAEAKYGHPDIRDALVGMFSGKCAYCESRIVHAAYAHIEHYRPRSAYPNETFTWENLLLACGVCNGPAGKGSRFPEGPEGGPLLNPTGERPSEHLSWSMTADIASVVPKTVRGRTTCDTLRLNRPELRAYRSHQMRLLAFVALSARMDSVAASLLEEACSQSGEFAAFAREIATTVAGWSPRASWR